MGDVPDEFLEGWREGHFPAAKAWDFIEETPEREAAIREYLDEGLSLEWAFAAYDQNMPGPNEWDSAMISRDDEGNWDVHIIDNDGNFYHIDAAANDIEAQDNIFSEFWDLVDEYDIEIERDISYTED